MHYKYWGKIKKICYFFVYCEIVFMHLKIATFNVAGLNDLVEQKSIFVKPHNVIFLQETHFSNM